ncbi:hypothetical protein HBI56_107030 [Parastagonospora nodorum]|uniref:F-box domain-containing protein n=2 Tax=Phaeosphaeria nodorum (strain SN15 / ATCC MYA-4574 / FGSC 10173) TaxID=321614 RepID=A0A7U2FCR5_PHANO|nr:hypothetical protein HBH56_131870 [Parastagonospora nodorum]QRD02862.1 hypothetical protein JI435_115850 [Parastagonospora nodorum SN15]KAH3927148.1 hypothetical protein HBH54_161350 [Parastagonospora nodorum]KAH3974552.1 hypothetical protein HBH52_134760 [Parastagonospora nodorum]KAH3995967.1 hypothetical protein HBI10_165870 [Parastagonospora nodorum]
MMTVPESQRAGPPPLPLRKPSSLQQNQKPLVHGGRQAKYNCSCGTNQEKVICSCATCQTALRGPDSPCSYYGNCVEPLAWNIENELVRTQDQCPLFTKLPMEIRTLIFEFALTDTGAKQKSIASLLKRLAPRGSPESKVMTCDMATTLLQTCRAVYLETWNLPLSLNPYIKIEPTGRGPTGVNLKALLPWQLSLIQRLDISVKQVDLEGEYLHSSIHANSHWQPGARHNGVYVAPRAYQDIFGTCTLEYPQSFNCALISAEEECERHFLSHILGDQDIFDRDAPPPWSSAMRVATAKPITHLTLRMRHADWWTWTDDPNSSDELHHLALDPSVGDGSADHPRRPTASRMRALAEERRAGRHPEVKPDVGWAETIAQMPDLRSFEMVLETYASKKGQLDAVVEAAKTWRFGLDGGVWELVWDGKVGVSSWSRSGKKVTDNAEWYLRENAFEVRDVRFTRKRVA